MMTYENWYELYRERVYNWVEDVRYLIYQCWVVGVNPEWVIARLNNNEYIAIYQKFLTYAKEYEYDDKEIVSGWIKEIRRMLYHSCTSLIAEYCLG